MKKINSKIMGQLLDTFSITENKEEYVPLVDYTEYGLESDEKASMVVMEKEVSKHISNISKSSIELSETLFKAQSILAKSGSGSFVKWFQMLGLKKDFVYMLLKRYDLYKLTKKIEVFSLPEKNIKIIAKMKNSIEIKELQELVDSENPLEEIENHLSGDKKDEKIEIIPILVGKNYKIFENFEKKIENLDNKKRKKVDKLVEELEKLLS